MRTLDDVADAGPDRASRVAEIDLPLTHETFVLKLLRELTGAIEDVVGVEQASGYVSTVGAIIGEWLNNAYHAKLGPEDFDVAVVARIFVDLKDRIEGEFYIKSIEADRIVLGNHRCPFGDYVRDRPSLCMMTSNVFGRIAADNLGYARVALEKTIAGGHDGCEVVVYLKPQPSRPVDDREYYRVPRLPIG